MSCSENTCGIGKGTYPQPGDPDNNLLLTATPAFGGIDVEWTYPNTNPEAVAHVRLYRGTIPEFLGTVLHKIVSGNTYYDKIDGEIHYYYWIEVVSVNGTIGEPIGPASATARLTIDQVMEQLTGKIDAGTLATALKAELDRIEVLNTSINQESAARVQDGVAIAEALSTVQAALDEATALLQQEVITRADQNSALVDYTTTAQTTMNESLASVQVDLQTNIESLGGEVTEIGALYTAKVTVDGLVGGFGVHNDGTSVEAGFDVDTFWVGRTQANKRKPFIIVGNETFIDEAVINKLTFNKLRSADGTFIVEGDRLKAGFINATSLDVVNGTFSGVLNGATGTFSGKLSAGTVDFSSSVGSTVNYLTPGTYTLTVPANMNSMRLTLRGGGGGGGGGSTRSHGAGGGGGASPLTNLTVNNLTPGQTFTLTVGAGGAGGPAFDYLGGLQYPTAGGATTVAGVASSAGGTAGGILNTTRLTGVTGCFHGVDGAGTGAGAGAIWPSGGTGKAATQAGAGGGGGFGTDAMYGDQLQPTNGGNGGSGSAVVEYFDSTGVVLRPEMATLKNELRNQGLTIS